MAIREGFWDCVYCDTKKIKGREYDCPYCGKERGKDISFYLASDSNVLSMEEGKKISKEADWYCEYCDSLNPSTSKECLNCSGGKETKTYFDLKKEKSAKKKIDFDTCVIYPEDDRIVPDIGNEDFGTQNNDYIQTKLYSKNDFLKKKNKFIFGLFCTIGIICGAFLFFFIFQPKEFIVDAFSWENTITIDEYKTVERSGWTLPHNGVLKSQKEEISGYTKVFSHNETKTKEVSEQKHIGTDKVVVGVKDLGNGYFEDIISEIPKYETVYRTEKYEESVYEDEPIYSTKYYYEIDDWVYKETYITKELNKNIYDHDYILNNIKPNERIGTKNIIYYIHLKDDKGNVKIYKTNKSSWENLKIGDINKYSIFGDLAKLITKK